MLWWLLGGTVLATLLFLRRAVLTRWEGGLLLVGGYAGFAWIGGGCGMSDDQTRNEQRDLDQGLRGR